jgi:hypothetical protein
VSLQTFLASAFRIASWLAAGSLGLLGAIVLCDGLMSSVAARYRAVTLIVSLLFITAGLEFFALERNLSRVRHHQDAIHGGSSMPRESIGPWRMIHAILALAAGGTFLLTIAGILGVVGRLKSGVSIFG